MNWSECGKKRTWLNSRYYHTTCLEGVEKKHTQKNKTSSQDSRHPSKYHKNIIPKYKSETLKHEPACS